MDTLRVKKRLVERGNFSDAQAEDIVEAFTEEEEGFVTVRRLRAELRKTELRIVGAVVAINALFLTAARLL
jgi:hypothetical protein